MQKGLPCPAPHLSYQQSRRLYFQNSSGIHPLLTIFQVTIIPHLLASYNLPQLLAPGKKTDVAIECRITQQEYKQPRPSAQLEEGGFPQTVACLN